MIKDLDKWAEDEFSKLCAAAGVTRNKAIQDRTGWDYLIEFPVERVSKLSADLQPTEQSARVQVKSKAQGQPKVAIKLSNAFRFAKDPLPCFVLLFLATNSGEPVQIFARHVGEADVARVLKRVRLAGSKGQQDLNKLTVIYSFTENDCHTLDLLRWIKSEISASGPDYLAWKSDLVQTVGFAEGAFHGTVKFNYSDLPTLIDHQLGLDVEAPSLEVSLKQKRFGIDAKEPMFEGQPSFVQMKSYGKSCRLRVRNSSGVDQWLVSEFFTPAIPDLPVEFRKVRVVSDFFELVFSPTGEMAITVQWKFNADMETKRSLKSIREFTSFVQSANSGQLEFQLSQTNKLPLTFCGDIALDVLAIDIPQYERVLFCLETVSNGVLPADLTLSLQDIHRAWNKIADFNGLITGADLKISLKIGSDDSNTALEFATRPPETLFLFDWVDIGDWTFMAVVRRDIVEFHRNEEEMKIVCGPPRTSEAIVRVGKGDEHAAEIGNLYRQACDQSPFCVLEICGGDYSMMRSFM